MDTAEMTLDPKHVAEMLKLYRSVNGITQDNLAQMCGLTTRSIEKYESGTHAPNVQALRSLCRGMKVEAEFFRKPTPEEVERSKAEYRKLAERSQVVRTHPVATEKDFLGIFSESIDAWMMDDGNAPAGEAMDIVAGLFGNLSDWTDVWDDVPYSSRLEGARGLVDQAKQLERFGLRLYLGACRQVTNNGKSPLTFRVGIASIQPIEGAAGVRHAVVQCQPGWLPHPDERIPTGA